MSWGLRPHLLLLPRKIWSGAPSPNCPWMIHSRRRRLLLLVPPRIIQSGASGLFSALVGVVSLWLPLPVLPLLFLSWALHGLVTALLPHHVPLHQHGLLPFAASLIHLGLVLLAAAPLHHDLAGLRSVRAAGGASWWAPLAGLGVAWNCLACLGCVRVVRAVRVCCTRRPLLLGTWSCAVVVAGGVPLWRASWPCIGAPHLAGPVAPGALVGFPVRCGAFPHSGESRPQDYWAITRVTWRTAENLAHGACPGLLLRQGRWARSASYPFGAPRLGYSCWVPPASVFGCVRCGILACVDPVTRASGFLYRTSFDGGIGRCTGAVSCRRRQFPFLVRGGHARVPCTCACARRSWPGRAGLPPGRVFARAHLFFWPLCPPALLGPLRAGVAPFSSFCWPAYFSLFFLSSFRARAVSGSLLFRALAALGLLTLAPHVFFCPLPHRVVFFFAPPHCLLGFLWFPAPGVLGLGALRFPPPTPLFFFIPGLRF